MINAKLFVEGGGDSKELKVRCREGFSKLLQKSGFLGRMPRIVACGGRGKAYDGFQTEHRQKKPGYVALLVDSEEPVMDQEKTWLHLNLRDKWEKPEGAIDQQAFLMTTCMETWIVADRKALKVHYGVKLKESALPPENELEQRSRYEVQDKLCDATKDCSNAYTKNKLSYEMLANIDPAVLRHLLPAFARMVRILEEKL